MKRKIIIEFDDNLTSASHAMELVGNVVNHGKVSKAIVQGYPCDHYCWATTFKSGYTVETKIKKRLMAADSFRIVKLTPKPTVMPDWMRRQFDNSEHAVSQWSDGKCEAAGIPRQKKVNP